MSHRHPLWIATPLVLSIAPIVTLALVGASAQERPADPGASTRTIEGCLTRPDGASSSATAGQFVLIEGSPSERTTPSPAGRQPTSGAVPAPPQAVMYVLRSDDDDRVRFPPFVGHRIRATGTTTAPSTTAPLAGRSPEATPYQAPVATPSATSGATGTPFDTANLPTLVVRSITSLAETCK